MPGEAPRPVETAMLGDAHQSTRVAAGEHKSLENRNAELPCWRLPLTRAEARTVLVTILISNKKRKVITQRLRDSGGTLTAYKRAEWPCWDSAGSLEGFSLSCLASRSKIPGLRL